jgi:CO/xanthine dehydrogenase Mo-binding subunit
MAYAAGAFPGSPIGSGALVILAPYRIDNLQIDGYDVVVNRPKTAAYRAPGSTNAAFAAETVIDELCEKLHIDPLEFRRINGVQEGDRRADGQTYKRIGYLETVEALQAHPHYSEPLKGKYRGRGVASGFWANWGGKSSVAASVNADGIVSLIEGSTDIGGSRTSIAMQLAEALDIPVEDVKPQVVDTDSVGYNDVTGGSRTTFATGWAAYELAQAIKWQMTERLAALWEVEPGQVHYQDGIFVTEGIRASFRDAVAELASDKPIVAAVAVHPLEFGPGFATHVVDVEVDPETGKVTILRYTAAQDVGRAIHPTYVEGQIQGAVAQGVGWALNEEYVYDNEGHLTNATYLDYRMPTMLDLPMIEAVLVEVPNPGHPYGVRGVGEVPIVSPAAAVANAIYDAVGVRLTELPMSPPRVWAALEQAHLSLAGAEAG